MTDQTISAPWRDGTDECQKSLDLFNQVVGWMHEQSPSSTEYIRENGVDAYFIRGILGQDGINQMYQYHLDYLISALSDVETLDNIDKTAARVREIMRVSV